MLPLNRYEKEVSLRSRDGWRISGSLGGAKAWRCIAVLVHGAGADRREDGFYDGLVQQLWGNAVATLRIDLRGHGKSEGSPEDITLTGVLNDIDIAITSAAAFSSSKPHLVGASFGGGMAAVIASQREVASLTLVNPVLDYCKRMLADKGFSDEKGYLSLEAADSLIGRGWLPHYGTIKMNRFLINEIPWINPLLANSMPKCRTLVLQGTKDSKVPITITRSWVRQLQDGHLVAFHGAEHELAMPGDEAHLHEQTARWHRRAEELICQWINNARY